MVRAVCLLARVVMQALMVNEAFTPLLHLYSNSPSLSFTLLHPPATPSLHPFLLSWTPQTSKFPCTLSKNEYLTKGLRSYALLNPTFVYYCSCTSITLALNAQNLRHLTLSVCSNTHLLGQLLQLCADLPHLRCLSLSHWGVEHNQLLQYQLPADSSVDCQAGEPADA